MKSKKCYRITNDWLSNYCFKAEWSTWPWNRCRAKLPKRTFLNVVYRGRCDLKKGHSGDHCLERGMTVVLFKEIEEPE